jgi:hypothetical protein
MYLATEKISKHIKYSQICEYTGGRACSISGLSPCTAICRIPLSTSGTTPVGGCCNSVPFCAARGLRVEDGGDRKGVATVVGLVDLDIQKYSNAASKRKATPPTTPPTIAPVSDLAVSDDCPWDVDPLAVMDPGVGVVRPPEVTPIVPPADVLDEGPVGAVPPPEGVPADAPPPGADVPKQRS